MRLSSEAVYPITRKFELFLKEQKLIIVENDDSYQFNYLGPAPDHAVRTAIKMHEFLGEYEHGTAEIETLFDEIAVMTPVPGSEGRVMSGWSSMEDGTTETQEDWSLKMEKAMLENLAAIYMDLLLGLIHN